MTQLSRKARYALRALYALPADDARGPVLIADLAEREKIPRKSRGDPARAEERGNTQEQEG
jgi:hypothetical protein